MMPQKKILIVGGGTAGWMTANLFAKHWQHKNIEICLLEAPDIPIIGVGEGSTPYIRTLFEQLEIPEQEWMSKCNATFKNGIQFDHWSSTEGYSGYFHPFLSEIDELHLPAFEHNTQLKRQGFDVTSHPDHFFLMTELTKQGKLPHSPKNFPFNNAYGYHFDANLLGSLLRENAIKLGVKHVQAKVEQVTQTTSGDIESVVTDKNEHFYADLFVDCTGFKALLIEKTLKVPFISYADNLFNDSAVAIPSKALTHFKPQTVSTAMSAGWAWQIPLNNRVGNGYVYSAKYQSADSAEAELRDKIGEGEIIGEARHLKMRVGRTSKHWVKNCVAIGLSQGFIEPLEATALHLVQKTIEDFIEAYQLANFTNAKQDWFNNKTNYAFERLRDYIVLHYLTNTRKNSQYWHDARTKIQLSDSLKQVMTAWLSGNNIRDELIKQDITSFYSSASWHAMLAGVGIFPISDKAPQPLPSSAANINVIRDFITRCAANFSAK